MKIALITIGAELLNGTRTDTNATWIGQSVIPVGAQITWHRTVPDNREDIIAALNEIPGDVEVVCTTGGLGPTHDDITPRVLFEYFGAKSVFDEDYWSELSERFAKRGKTIPESNRNQAIRPDKGEVIPNPNGSARGLHFSNEKYHIFSMPGVPSEMKSMMTVTVLPWINERSHKNIAVQTLRTTGIMESALYQKLEPILENFKHVEVAFLPRLTGVDLRVTSDDTSTVKEFIKAALAVMGNYHYGDGEVELEDVVGKILKKRGLTVATAESCTGGLIGDRITNTAGSSAYMRGGVIAYCNAVKKEVLGVKKATLARVGAVSEETAREMAEGVRKVLKADIGLSSTGIAGPTGGTAEKPIGLVFIALASAQETKVFQFRFTHHRKANKLLTSQTALNLLRIYLLNG